MMSNNRRLQVAPETRIGVLKLRVTNLDNALAIWRDMVGLHLIEQAEDKLVMGVGTKPMIELTASATSPVPPRSLGLYHVAIHVPRRKELARAVARQLKSGVRTLPTDHLVSEATYLWDMDGNGIELTFETPERGTYTALDDGIEIETKDGSSHSGREPIDLDDLFSELTTDDDLMAPLPEGTRLGHIHVHVRDLYESMEFYADVLGFQRQILSTDFGMGDVRTNYEPHILAFNIWSGATASQSPADSAGLTEFEVVLTNPADLDNITGRLEKVSHAFERLSNQAIALTDPSGNPMHIRVG